MLVIDRETFMQDPEAVPEKINLDVCERLVRIRHYAKHCPNKATAKFIRDGLLSIVRILEKNFELTRA